MKIRIFYIVPCGERCGQPLKCTNHTCQDPCHTVDRLEKEAKDESTVHLKKKNRKIYW